MESAARMPICRGLSVADLSNGFASCPELIQRRQCDTRSIHTKPSYFTIKMSGAGYDVVVDVDEEVSLRSLKHISASP